MLLCYFSLRYMRSDDQVQPWTVLCAIFSFEHGLYTLIAVRGPTHPSILCGLVNEILEDDDGCRR